MRNRQVRTTPVNRHRQGPGGSVSCQKRNSNLFDRDPFGENLRPRVFVVGDPNHIRLLKFVLYIKLGAARVVDVPAEVCSDIEMSFPTFRTLCMCSG